MKFDNQMDIDVLLQKIKVLVPEERVEVQASMSKLTSFKAGGNADIFVLVENIGELKDVLTLLSKEKIQHMLIGNGSNILVKDSGYRGVVVKQGEFFNQIDVNGEEVTAFAGARLSAVAKVAMESSLSGLEFASGIPGSVGGGVFMNAGAYGGELSDVLISATILKKDGSEKFILSKDELELEYRHSLLHETGDIVISTTFKLEKGDKVAISEKMKGLLEKRNQKQPVQLPSGGSFFKRPTGFFAGALIEEAGLKGLSVGDAQVSPLHAGFIVNNGKATATDILQLMSLVQNTVNDKFGVWLEPEVRIIGE